MIWKVLFLSFNFKWQISIQRDCYGIIAIYQRELACLVEANRLAETCNIYDTCIECMFNSNKKLYVLKINEVNWNILLTSGKEIKGDSLSNVNEIRKVLNK